MANKEKFYGQFKPPQDKLLNDRYFPDVKGGVFLECGAFDGITESSCFLFEESRNWTGYNIEAVTIIFEKLKINRPLSINE